MFIMLFGDIPTETSYGFQDLTAHWTTETSNRRVVFLWGLFGLLVLHIVVIALCIISQQ